LKNWEFDEELLKIFRLERGTIAYGKARVKTKISEEKTG